MSPFETLLASPPPAPRPVAATPATPFERLVKSPIQSAQIQTNQPATQVKTIPPKLGGGAYNLNPKSPQEIVNTGRTTYAGMPPKAGFQRNDIVPVSLGGANTSKENIQYQPANEAAYRDKIEQYYAGQVKTGRIATDAARVKVLDWQNTEIPGQPAWNTRFGGDQNLFSNLIKSIPEVIGGAVQGGKSFLAKTPATPLNASTEFLPQKADTSKPFSQNAVLDNNQAAAKQLVTTAGGFLPGMPTLAHGITTGDWQPYLTFIKDKGIDTQKLANPDPAIHGPEMAKLQNMVIVLGVHGALPSGEEPNIPSDTGTGQAPETVAPSGGQPTPEEPTIVPPKTAPGETSVVSPPNVNTASVDIANRYWDEQVAPDLAAGKPTVIGADYIKDWNGGDYAEANHGMYSKAAFQNYNRGLQENPDPEVAILGGGPGSGKTELVTNHIVDQGFKGVIYDSNASSYVGLKNALDAAKAAGKEPEIYGVVPDLASARAFTLSREAQMGRSVSDASFATGHVGFPEAVINAIENGDITPDKVHILDTRGITSATDVNALAANGSYAKDPLALLKALGYDIHDVRTTYAKTNFTQGNNSELQNGEVRQSTNRIPQENGADQVALQVSGKNLVISPESRDLLQSISQDLSPKTATKVGPTMTNQEVIDFAKANPNLVANQVSRDASLKYNAALLNARQQLADTVQNGGSNQDIIRAFMQVKTAGTDLARGLQSMSIKAAPGQNSTLIKMLDDLLKTGANIDDIIAAAKNVDFNNYNAATDFYRQFIKPTAGDWIDLVRYNSMLSSPLTLSNISSGNLFNLATQPIVKSTAGAIDWLKTGVFGGEQTHFIGEGPAYAKGALSSINDAFGKLMDVLQGNLDPKQLDFSIPITGTEPATLHLGVGSHGTDVAVPSTIVKGLNIFSTLHNAMYQFFNTIAKGGTTAALDYRATQGVDTALSDAVAQAEADYTTFRAGAFPEGQGKLLNAMDSLWSSFRQWSQSDNSFLAWPTKSCIPMSHKGHCATICWNLA